MRTYLCRNCVTDRRSSCNVWPLVRYVVSYMSVGGCGVTHDGDTRHHILPLHIHNRQAQSHIIHSSGTCRYHPTCERSGRAYAMSRQYTSYIDCILVLCGVCVSLRPSITLTNVYAQRCDNRSMLLRHLVCTCVVSPYVELWSDTRERIDNQM